VNSLSYQPTEKGIYMFNKEHAGSSLVYIKHHKDYYEFAFLPGPSRFLLTPEEFTKALKVNVLEFVETLPDEIFNETMKCYNAVVK
jgi:hypothetical protein